MKLSKLFKIFSQLYQITFLHWCFCFANCHSINFSRLKRLFLQSQFWSSDSIQCMFIQLDYSLCWFLVNPSHPAAVFTFHYERVIDHVGSWINQLLGNILITTMQHQPHIKKEKNIVEESKNHDETLQCLLSS